MRLLAPETVESVRRLVEAPEYEDLSRFPEWNRFDLMRGVVGLGFFEVGRSRFLGSNEPPTACLERAVTLFNEHGAGPGLHSGIAGLGLFASLNYESPELLASIDESLCAQIGRSPPLPSLREGLAGFAIYASTRAKTSTGQALIDAVVGALEASAVSAEGGTTWFVPVDYARRQGLEVRGEPVVEAGMAHGQAGLVVGLTRLAQAGSSRARRLLEPAVRWLLRWPGAQRRHFGWALFGREGELGAEELPSTTWCTGDPGVARALWLAARLLDDSDARGLARELAGATASDALSRGHAGLDGRFDLCCGAAAVGHLLHRFFEETSDDRFKDAAAVTLTSVARQIDGMKEESLQFGRAGALVALMAASADAPAAWEAAFGLGP